VNRLQAAALLAACGLASSCQAIIGARAIDAPELASAKRAADFASYHIGRVGILPVTGSTLSAEDSAELQALCFSEFSELGGFELVLLTATDLAEIESSEPYRLGVYQPETILGISSRYRLDALLVASVSRRQIYPPQKLNMHMDLVASETGMTIWSSAVALQADRPDVRLGLEAFYGNGLSKTDDSWASALLSPGQFARFGIWQLARAL